MAQPASASGNTSIRSTFDMAIPVGDRFLRTTFKTYGRMSQIQGLEA
jgi:hypothetical protein